MVFYIFNKWVWTCLNFFWNSFKLVRRLFPIFSRVQLMMTANNYIDHTFKLVSEKKSKCWDTSFSAHNLYSTTFLWKAFASLHVIKMSPVWKGKVQFFLICWIAWQWQPACCLSSEERSENSKHFFFFNKAKCLTHHKFDNSLKYFAFKWSLNLSGRKDSHSTH